MSPRSVCSCIRSSEVIVSIIWPLPMTGARLQCIRRTVGVLALLCLLALHHVLAQNLGHLLGVLDGGRGAGGFDGAVLAEPVADLELCGRKHTGIACVKWNFSMFERESVLQAQAIEVGLLLS